MFKNAKRVLVLLIAAVFSIGLLACGRGAATSEEDGREALRAADVAGTYEIVSIEGDTAVSAEEAKTMKDLGLTVELVLKEEGTGTLDLFGHVMDLTFDVSEMTVSMEGQTIPFTYDNGKLVLKQNTGEMVFERAE